MNTSNKTNKHGHTIKSLMVRSALLLTLGLSAMSQLHADGPRNRFSGSEWRLGNHNEIYLRSDRGWQRVQGSAIDIADGWVIGTDRRNGGYGIYRWNGRRFDRMPGGAVKIGGSYERPWVINNRGERFDWTGRDWREVRNYGSNRNDRHDDHRNDRHDDNSHDRHDDRHRPSW